MKFLSAAPLTGAELARIQNEEPVNIQLPPAPLEFPFNQRGQDSGRYAIQRHALYDRCTFGREQGSAILFCEPVSSHRYYNETNMQMAQRLPMPQAMRVNRIFFIFDPDNDPGSQYRFCRDASWRFIIGERIYADGTFITSRTRANFSDVVKKGQLTGLVPLDSLILPNEFSLIIAEGQNFRIDVHCCHLRDRADRSIRFYAFLDGLLARGVQ